MDSIDSLISNILTKSEGEELIFEMETGRREASAHFIEEFRRVFFRKTFVGLTLAFEPRRDFCAKIKKVISESLGREAILDLTIDKNIVGGAILIANGHWRDYSLGSLVEESLS